MICQKCGTLNVEGDSFCGSCGAYLEWQEAGAASGVEGDSPPTTADGPSVGAGSGSGAHAGAGVGAYPGSDDATVVADAAPTVVAPPRTPMGNGPARLPSDVACWNCGRANQPGRTFCQQCGERLIVPKPAAQGAAAGTAAGAAAGIVAGSARAAGRGGAAGGATADGGGRRISTTLAAVLALLLVGAVAVFAFAGGLSSPTATPETALGSGSAAPSPSGSSGLASGSVGPSASPSAAFPSLPTMDPSVLATAPSPSAMATAEATRTPRPTRDRTPRPTRRPTPPATHSPTPTPTPAPSPSLTASPTSPTSCADISGEPTQFHTLSAEDPFTRPAAGKVWCLERVIFTGSEAGAGTVILAVNGATIEEVEQPADFESAEIVIPQDPPVRVSDEALVERVTACDPACGNLIQFEYVEIEAPTE